MQARGNLFEHPEFLRYAELAKRQPYLGRARLDVVEVTDGRWFVLELYSGREEIAIKQVADRVGLPVYLPMRRKLVCGRAYGSYSVARRALFVGYGFALARRIEPYVGMFYRCPDVLGVMTITNDDDDGLIARYASAVDDDDRTAIGKYASVDWNVIRHIQASENGSDESLTAAAQVALDADRKKRSRSRRPSGRVD